LRVGHCLRETKVAKRVRSILGHQAAWEQLIGVKSVEQAWEIQSQYAKKAFDAYFAHASKLSEMYVDLARNAYRPVEQATAKAARKVA